MQPVKNFKMLFILVFLAVFLAASLPASAASVYVGTNPLVVDAGETGVRLQVPSNSYTNGYTCEIAATDYKKIEQLNEFYVTRSVDITLKHVNPYAITLTKPARLVFSFDELDYKRASQMKANQPVGKFRIGRWNESAHSWDQLPSLIFWDGSTGIIEAEAREAGRYALLWTYEGSPRITPTAAEGIRLMVNYAVLEPDVAPYINNGRTMIPLRAVAESLNVLVNWNDAEKRVELTSTRGTVVRLWIGNTMAQVDSKTVQVDVPPAITDGRTFIPLRFVAEALGVTVSWDSFTRTAYLTTR
jgi:hypothetical protein